MLLSHEPEANVRPSGEKATLNIWSPRHSISLRKAPLGMSQMKIEPLSAPPATAFPFGAKAMLFTRAVAFNRTNCSI
jgi:hypothetical protein